MIKTLMIDWEPQKPRTLTNKKIKEKVLAFIQARTGSKRLPNKIYKDLNGAPLLYHTIARAKEASLINDVVVVSPEPLPDIPEGVKEYIYAGDETDVLDRYVSALQSYSCDYVVRLTSDCPLLDPKLIDFIIAESMGYDYGSNVLVNTFPDGMDVEIISANTLKDVNDWVLTKFDREHVTSYIRNNQSVQVNMKLLSVQSMKDYSYLKLSVDNENDLEVVRAFEHG